MNRTAPLLAILAFATAPSACGSSAHLTGAGGAGGTTGAGGSSGTTGAGGSSGTTGAAGSAGTTGAAGSAGTTGAAGSGACAFDAVYSYGQTGGLVAYQDEATLTPPSAYRYARHQVRTTTADTACTPALPACDSVTALDVSDIMRDVAAPDVQAALALTTPPLYGVDARPVDGTVFSFMRADGRGFLAGGPCTEAGTGTSCVAVPAGITRLVTDLQALDQQELADPTCAALR